MGKVKVYKLTHSDLTTHANYKWVPGHRHEISLDARIPKLCSDGVFHAYTSPELAWFLDPIHANYGRTAILWKAETTEVVATDKGLKVGTYDLTLTRKLDTPYPTPDQRVCFAILCAKQATKNRLWLTWANRWLSGVDRSKRAAADAYAANAAANAAAYAAADAAAYAAAVAAADAYAAAAYAAYAAANAAVAADAAAYAAYAAAKYIPINLADLAKEAMTMK